MAPSAGGAVASPNISVAPAAPTSLVHAAARNPLPLQHEGEKQHVDPLTDDSDLNEKAGMGGDGDGDREQEEEETDGTRFVKDPDGAMTHDETTVDVVAVPCPGGDRIRSWNRDGLLGRYFGALSMRDAEVDRRGTAPSWIRQGIRREADVARILLYEHPPADEGTTLGGLARSLLEDLRSLRDHEADGLATQRQRPLVFAGHSIGGLVLKMALVEASKDEKYADILRDCYGVVFFGTPHQGSSYFAMPGLSHSIQSLLQLSLPLPASITRDLCVGKSLLLDVDAKFKTVAHDIRVWTLYETIDSRLSGGEGAGEGTSTGGGAKRDGVYFTAPLVSVKSAILGMRQEQVYPLQSDHANVASFGRQNAHTLRLFLRQLAGLIRRADASVREEMEEDHRVRWSLDLDQKVAVEVRGFFEDASAGPEDPIVRAWSTRLPLKDFLRKGPEECLDDRLHEANSGPDEDHSPGVRPRSTSLTEAENDRIRREASTKDGLGIQNQLAQMPGSPPSPPAFPPAAQPADTSPRSAPEIDRGRDQLERVRRLSSPPPPTMSCPTPTPTRHSTPLRRPSPLMLPDFDQDLAIDRLSPPMRTRSFLSAGRASSDISLSPYEYRDFPPFSQQRSRSTLEDRTAVRDSFVLDASSGVFPQDGPTAGAARPSRNPARTADGSGAVGHGPANLIRPESTQRKFIWVHLPYNNPTWVDSMIQTLQTTYKKDYSALCGHDFWASKHTRGRHSQHYAYYAKPGCYFTAPRTLSPRRSHSTSPPMSPFRQQDTVSLCLFLPYLHFDSYKRLIRRRDLITQRLSHGRAHPVPEEVANSDSMELQVIWEFLGHDPPVNCRRTLDQFGYPALRDTRGRDDDQMLYKLTKERGCRYGQHHRDMYTNSLHSGYGSFGSHNSWRDDLADLDAIQEQEDGGLDMDDGVRNGNVLMVDQMWLWVIHSDTLLSFFPKRESDPIEGPLYQQADLRDSIASEVNVDLTRQCDNAFDLAALSALHAVSALLDRASHPDLEVFRIFGEAISVLTEKLTSSLKTFRVEGFRDKATAYEPDENKESSIRRRHREEGRRTEEENRDNTSALLELRDLEDELLVLQGLFERQQAVLSSMMTAYSSPTLRDRTAHGRAFIAEAIRRVDEYRHRADDMAQRVRSTRDEYDKLLQMVQRQAQVDEVRLSRLHADLASAQGRSVMIFTVFTIIFLPLSFFTSLFGMNTFEWERDGPMSLPVIGAVALPSSFVLVTLSLLAAFSSHTRRAIHWSRDLVADVLGLLYGIALGPLVNRAGRRFRRWRRSRGKQGVARRAEEMWESRRGMKREASDFWERNRLQREAEYRIPAVNRRVGVRERLGARGKKENQGRSA